MATARLSFKVTILVLFSVLTAILSAAVLYVNYARSSEAAVREAASLLEQLSGRILAATERMIDPLFSVTNSAILLPGVDAAAGARGRHPLEPVMIAVIERYPQMIAAYMGNASGDFYRVTEIQPWDAARRGYLKAPPEARFAVQSIVAGRDGRRDAHWRFLSTQRADLGERVEEKTAYDPRTRPWYIDAQKSAVAIVTDYYTFAASPSVGLTVARQLGDAKGTVFATDLTLSTVSRYLASLRDPQLAGTRNAEIAIFHVDGRLLAHSDNAAYEKVIRTGDTARIPTVSEIGSGAITAAVARFRASSADQMRVKDTDGVEWFARVAKLAPAFGDGAYLAIAVPVDDFLGPLARDARQTLLISVALVLAFLPLVYLAADAVSRPLGRVTREIAAIRDFALDPSPPVRSAIAEIQDLSSALATTKFMLRAFGKYVPKNLVRRIVRSGDEPRLGGKRRPVTVFFSDVRDFTTISEQVAPERLMEFTSEYLEGLVNVILGDKGTVDKFVGDQIMAYWNAPQLNPEHATDGCRAVLRCRDWSNAQNERWASEGQPILYTRFALHLGDAIVGNVGSSDRMDYTVVGATINLGSRIEGLNKVYGTQVLITRPVADAIDGRFVRRPIDRVLPKGAVHPLDVFELRGLHPDSAGEAPDLAVDANTVALCAAWEGFYSLYLARDWAAAGQSLVLFTARFGEDAVAKLYSERLREFSANPPAADWDGVIRYTTK